MCSRGDLWLAVNASASSRTPRPVIPVVDEVECPQSPVGTKGSREPDKPLVTDRVSFQPQRGHRRVRTELLAERRQRVGIDRVATKVEGLEAVARRESRRERHCALVAEAVGSEQEVPNRWGVERRHR